MYANNTLFAIYDMGPPPPPGALLIQSSHKRFKPAPCCAAVKSVLETN